MTCRELLASKICCVHLSETARVRRARILNDSWNIDQMESILSLSQKYHKISVSLTIFILISSSISIHIQTQQQVKIQVKHMCIYRDTDI